ASIAIAFAPALYECVNFSSINFILVTIPFTSIITKKATTEVTAFFQGDGREKTNGKVSLRLRLSTLNLLQATASTVLATRPVFGDWEKSKSFLYLFQHSYVAALLVLSP
ncbi:hypothetical protein V4483_25125, partial [Bacillus paranthracis]